MGSGGGSSDHRREEILEEYRTLRRELEEASNRRFTIFASTVSAWAALGAWVVTAKNIFTVEVALCALHVPLVAGYALFKIANRHVTRVSAYLRTFIEPELPGIRWETRAKLFQSLSTNVFSLSQVSTAALLLMSLGSFGLEQALGLPRRITVVGVPGELIVLAPLWLVAIGVPVLQSLKYGSRGYEPNADAVWRQVKASEEP